MTMRFSSAICILYLLSAHAAGDAGRRGRVRRIREELEHGDDTRARRGGSASSALNKRILLTSAGTDGTLTERDEEYDSQFGKSSLGDMPAEDSGKSSLGDMPAEESGDDELPVEEVEPNPDTEAPVIEQEGDDGRYDENGGGPTYVGGSGGTSSGYSGKGGRAGGSKSGRSGISIKGGSGGFREEGIPETNTICTCVSCTEEVMNTEVGGYTCGERMAYLVQNYPDAFPTTASACRRVAGLEFPEECGACNPFACDGRTEPIAPEFFCNCETCTEEVWNADAGGFTCAARVSWAQIVDQASEQDACALVAGIYPQCGACNPNTCSVPITLSPTVAGRAEPTLAPVTTAPFSAAPATPAPFSAAPVTPAPFSAAPATASPTGTSQGLGSIAPYPTVAPILPGTAAPQTMVPVASVSTPTPTSADDCPEHCGCWECINAWGNDANGLTCGERINWLIGTNIGEDNACRVVGGQEFPSQCGACNPDTCDGHSEGTDIPFSPLDSMGPTEAIAQVPTTASPVVSTSMPVASIATPAPSIVAAVVPDSTPAPTSSETIASIDTEAPSFVAAGSSESDVYCYPPSSERKRYTNVWGTCLLEAKDSGDGVCGPSDNAFADELVTLDENDVLTLSFASSNGLWYGSEVRMVQTTAPYTYGTYTYNIKEIRVIDLASGAVVGNTLPAGLVLGMFTWDPAHAEGEEDLYEVDIEVSQWGDSTNADVQFLLQPPEEPHFYRFVSGTNGDLVQAPQTYEFTWLPTSVAWYSTAGGGQNLLYTTEQAVSAGQTDRIQCLPANIEARIALWSTQSAGVDPVGMTTDHKVEVVVDSFVFTPIAVTGVADGEACSKSCQCLSGFCQNGAVCATV